LGILALQVGALAQTRGLEVVTVMGGPSDIEEVLIKDRVADLFSAPVRVPIRFSKVGGADAGVFILSVGDRNIP